MSEIRQDEKKRHHNGPLWLHASFLNFYFQCAVKRRKQTRTLIKNCSQWRYESQFIPTFLARRSKRLTTEWFATSVNLSKWAACQIFATALALNNLQYCTSVSFHFCLFSFPVSCKQTNHYTGRVFFSSFGALLIKKLPFGNGRKDKQKQLKRTFLGCCSHHSLGDINVIHLAVMVFPLRTYVPPLGS